MENRSEIRPDTFEAGDYACARRSRSKSAKADSKASWYFQFEKSGVWYSRSECRPLSPRAEKSGSRREPPTLAGVGVEAAPVADAVEAHQPDGEQLLALALLAEFGLASFANLGLHPFAVHAVLREHQQQAVVDLDGPVDLLDEFLAPLHVFRSEPDPQLFATHLLVQPPSELGTCGIHCVRLLS